MLGIAKKSRIWRLAGRVVFGSTNRISPLTCQHMRGIQCGPAKVELFAIYSAPIAAVYTLVGQDKNLKS